MALYESLAPIYDELFPADPASTSFLDSLARAHAGPQRSLLDAGSASGSQVLDLARLGWRGLGIEPCLPMLDLAWRKADALGLGAGPKGSGSARFVVGDMRDCESIAGEERFDLLLCLGNTLPHLEGPAEVESFLVSARRLAWPGAAIALQLLNYSLAGPGYAFPELRAAGWTFRRRYEAAPLSPGRLRFLTELAPGEEAGPPGASAGPRGPALIDETPLSALPPGQVAAALAASGWSGTRLLSGWAGLPFEEGSDPYLLAVAFAAD